jgi:divalent metal cation (Fe/Co/Zn/Cd) transporter
MAVVMLALSCNLAIATAMAFAAAWTGSSAVLAQTVHALAGALSQALLLYGLWWSVIPGGGVERVCTLQERCFWGPVVGILVFATGAGIAIHEGVRTLFDPRPLFSQQISYAVLGIAIAVQAAVASTVLRSTRARRRVRGLPGVSGSNDPAFASVLIAQMAVLAGLVAALAGIAATHLLGLAAADAAGALVIGIIQSAVAAILAVEVKGALHGERPLEFRPGLEPRAGDIECRGEDRIPVESATALPSVTAAASSILDPAPASAAPLVEQAGQRGRGKGKRKRRRR